LSCDSLFVQKKRYELHGQNAGLLKGVETGILNNHCSLKGFILNKGVKIDFTKYIFHDSWKILKCGVLEKDGEISCTDRVRIEGLLLRVNTFSPAPFSKF
jgi:hypothetical protein